MALIALRAYWRERVRSLLFAAIGFGLITIGSLLEGVYQFGLEGTYFLTGLELLRLQTVENWYRQNSWDSVLSTLVRGSSFAT